MVQCILFGCAGIMPCRSLPDEQTAECTCSGDVRGGTGILGVRRCQTVSVVTSSEQFTCFFPLRCKVFLTKFEVACAKDKEARGHLTPCSILKP